MSSNLTESAWTRTGIHVGWIDRRKIIPRWDMETIHRPDHQNNCVTMDRSIDDIDTSW